MRLRLRTIFETATSPNSLRRAAAITLASLFTLSVHSSSYQLNSFEDILRTLPHQASPFQSREIPSGSENNHYQISFESALNSFRSECPAIPQNINSNQDAVSWVYTHLQNESFENTPLSFRDATYNLVVTFDESENKNRLITELNRTLPNSTILMEYLEEKRVEISDRLRDDQHIQYAARHWNEITDTEIKRSILQRVARITLETLLPNKEIEVPNIVWDTNNLSNSTYAEYWNDENEIPVNARLNPTNFTFSFAMDMTIHESLHAFQSILANWGMRGQFRGYHDIDRFVRMLYTNKLEGVAAIRFNPAQRESLEQYFLTKTESMSWGFSVIGDTVVNPRLRTSLHNNLERDMYTIFDARAPRLRERHVQLLETPLSSIDNRTNAGTLPRVCLR